MNNLNPTTLSNLVNAYSGLFKAIAAIEGVEMPEVRLDINPNSSILDGQLEVVAGPIRRQVGWNVNPDPVRGAVNLRWDTPDVDPAYEILHRRF